MGQCLSICCPNLENDSGIASEASPLLDPRSRNSPVEVDDCYPRDDEHSQLDKIVRDTAGAFVDINCDRDVSIGTSRDKESIYQSTLATLPKQETNIVLPDCGVEDPNEEFSKTTVTRSDVERVGKQAEQANANLSCFKINSDENLIEEFDNTPKN